MKKDRKGKRRKKRYQHRRKAGLYLTLICSLILLSGCLLGYGILHQKNPSKNGTEPVKTQKVQEVQAKEQEIKEQEEPSPGQEEAQEDAEQAEKPDTEAGEESVQNTGGTAEGTADTPVTISIMGDSISTFDGWLPEGFYDFYPLNGEVKEVEQTWWKMLLEETGLQLCVNASSSGSTCVGDSTSTDDPQSGCSDYRISALADEDGNAPDLIIVYMGTNDVIQNIPLGDNDGSRSAEEGTIENFSDAYCLILDKLRADYPQAQIYCCSLLPVGDWGTTQPFETFVNGENLTSHDYSSRIETIARTKGFPVIDLENCGLTVDNMPQYVSDGVHLNPEGMKLLKDTIKAAIAGNL